MPARQLTTLRVDKPWGRTRLWPGFADPALGEQPVGEVWFDAGKDADAPLLIKYLFTSDRLSVQVHPDDTAAQAAGYPRGKDEAWVILAAEPGSTIALGTRDVTSREALAAGALDGSIVDMLDWRPVKAGHFIYSAAGTVHAIGPDITLIEVQQNLDLTYRLYDYGSPRELQLDAGIAVSEPVPFIPPPVPAGAGEGRTVLCEGGKFVIERWSWHGARTVTLPDDVSGWLTSIAGGGSLAGRKFAAGECWLIDGTAALDLDAGADVLFAYPLSTRLPLFH